MEQRTKDDGVALQYAVSDAGLPGFGGNGIFKQVELLLKIFIHRIWYHTAT